MNKAKRQVNKFVNHLFGMYRVPRIPVYVHWHHPSVVSKDGMCGFGVFCFGGDEKPCIHVGGKTIGKTGVLSVIAHEFVHYLQYLHGWDLDNDEESERAAEHYGDGLLGQWLINHKDKESCIDGLFNAWDKWNGGAEDED